MLENQSSVSFPSVTGSNLARQTFHLPQDFAGELNIVFIAFQQWQQRDIDTWLPLARKIAALNPDVRYYELPVIRSMNFIARAFIDGGMRAGIPNQTARETTITLYLDKADFRQALSLPTEEQIYVLLVDAGGKVVARDDGRFTSEKGNTLTRLVAQYLHAPTLLAA